MRGRILAAVAAALLSATPAGSQSRNAVPAAPPPPPPASIPATSAAPQQTTATFADWTLRCTRASPAAPVCEVVQGINSQDRTVAQLAIGRVAKGQPLHLTILVPPSVSFATAPALATARDGDPAVLALAWRRCLPGGCVADGTLTDETMRRVRAWTEPARVTFADAAGRTIVLPFSPQGLPQALDALAKEDGG